MTTKQEKITALDAMVESKAITPKGRDFIVQALDPFHDWTFEAVGLPDSMGERSVIICAQQSITVECEQHSDVHIVVLPNLVTATFENAQVAGPEIREAGNPTYGDIGLITAVKVPTGQRTFPDQTGPLDLGSFGGTTQTIDVSQYTTTSSLRVVSVGFEVHNTTAEVFKSGSVVTYRNAQNKHLTAAVYVDSSDLIPRQTYRARLPPATQASALATPGSRMWEAYDGNYSVAIVSHAEHAHLRDYNDLVFMARDSLQLSDSVSALVTRPNEVYGGKLYPGLDITGAYYAGLQTGTSLTVTSKIFLEIFPTSQDGVIQLLAQPSPPHDQAALDLYARAVSMLPPGCKVADNAGGDWWRATKAVVNSVAPRLTERVSSRVDQVKQVTKGMKELNLARKSSKDPLNHNPNFGQDSIITRPSTKGALINQGRKRRRLA